MPSNFFLMASASSLVAFSLSALGAPSTRSLASLRPSEVTSRTALMVLILFAPASLRMTWNSVFSSTAGAAAAPPPAATATGAAAAAETPRRSSSFFTRAAASSRLRLTICSSNCARSAIFLLQSQIRLNFLSYTGCQFGLKVSDAPDSRTSRQPLQPKPERQLLRRRELALFHTLVHDHRQIASS